MIGNGKWIKLKYICERTKVADVIKRETERRKKKIVRLLFGDGSTAAKMWTRRIFAAKSNFSYLFIRRVLCALPNWWNELILVNRPYGCHFTHSGTETTVPVNTTYMYVSLICTRMCACVPVRSRWRDGCDHSRAWNSNKKKLWTLNYREHIFAFSRLSFTPSVQTFRHFGSRVPPCSGSIVIIFILFGGSFWCLCSKALGVRELLNTPPWWKFVTVRPIVKQLSSCIREMTIPTLFLIHTHREPR